jgi:hypothetical protein
MSSMLTQRTALFQEILKALSIKTTTIKILKSIVAISNKNTYPIFLLSSTAFTGPQTSQSTSRTSTSISLQIQTIFAF